MPFADRFAPALDYPNVDPDNLAWSEETGSMAAARRYLMTALPQGKPEIAGRKDWQHLVTGQPGSAKVAGDQTAPSTGKQASADDWQHLVTGKPEPQRPSEPPEPPPEPDLSGGFGIVAKGFKKAPLATAAIGAPLAVGAAIPIAGTAAMGAAALPLWAQVIGAYYGLPYAARKIGEIAGAPQTGEAVGSLMDLVSQAGHAIAP